MMSGIKSGIKWNNAQKRAICEEGGNLLVAAGAGSGKTAVLVARVLRKIMDAENPIDIDRLLIVTFTNAAAAEMRERIGNAIIGAIEQNTASGPLQRQLVLLNRASICTLHSFCLDVIRNNAHLLDIDPAFRIADETEADLLKLEAVEELLDGLYESEPRGGDFFRLIDAYSGTKDDAKLSDLILEIYEFAWSNPWPEKWLEHKAALFASDHTDFGLSVWGCALLHNMRVEMSGICALMRQAYGLSCASDLLQAYRMCIGEELTGLERIRTILDQAYHPDRVCAWDDLCDIFAGFDFNRLPQLRRAENKAQTGVGPSTHGTSADLDETAGMIRLLRENARNKYRQIRDDIFSSKSADIAGDIASLQPMMNMLSRVVTAFAGVYAAKKKARGVLDFTDIEHYCLMLLTEPDSDSGNPAPSRIARDLQSRYEEILVDEYQDTNFVQEAIIGLVSRECGHQPNIFMVGDVKQSIYRFRHARPELFLDKYNSYSDINSYSDTNCDNAADTHGIRILLDENYRSRAEVLHALNHLFRRLMRAEACELDYGVLEELRPAPVYDDSASDDSAGKGIECGGPVELHLIDMKDITVAAEGRDPSVDDGSARLEARLAALKIKEMVNSDRFRIFDSKDSGYRPVRFRDVAILMRATKDWSDVFTEELSLAGIPVFADTNSGYFEAVEVRTMISLLQVIDNTRQDIPLLAVLRSPVGGFSPEELAIIRINSKGTDFFTALEYAALKGNEQGGKIGVKAASFLDKLADWRVRSQYMSTSELVWYLYEDTGYYSYVGAMPGGLQRQANLRIFFERARKFEETSYKGLFNFITFIEKVRLGRGDMGSARLLGENEDVVRIMSVHKSKGLEFPVVILAGCAKRFNYQDMNRMILLHHELGYGPEYVDADRRIRYPTAVKLAVRYKLKLEALSEEMRILYVALTRAREKLIITASLNNPEASLQKWASHNMSGDCPDSPEGGRLPVHGILDASNLMDWIGSAVLPSGAFVCNNPFWTVSIWPARQFATAKGGRSAADVAGILPGGEESLRYRDEVFRRLGWEYPRAYRAMIPAKISVTELKRYADAAEPPFQQAYQQAYAQGVPSHTVAAKRPFFIEETEGLTPIEKGIALHFVMQHLDLASLRDIRDKELQAVIDELRSQVVRMAANDMLTMAEADSVDIMKIAWFFSTPLGIRMLKADRISREVSFTIEMPYREVFPDLKDDTLKNNTPKDREPAEEKILVQGMIDCLFEDAGGMVLLDYKTDYIPKGKHAEIKQAYRRQIEFYVRAAMSLYGQNNISSYIYFFWDGSVVEY